MQTDVAMKPGSIQAMLSALSQHWPEYLAEAAELGLFMISACLFVALVEHPASPVRQVLWILYCGAH